MVKILYYRTYNRVTVEGHAGDAPRGESLVCAACSVLLHTIIRNVTLWMDEGLVDSGKIQEQEGYGQVSYLPFPDSAGDCAAVIEGICEGFRWLALEYPDHVSYASLG